MNRIWIIKKRFSIVVAVLVISLFLLICSFSAHCSRVNEYNNTLHTISGLDLENAEDIGVSIDIHPRGGLTDTWNKWDDVLGKTIKANIYEAQVFNGSGAKLSSWTLKFNINEDCYINNSWCGSVEIYQRDGSKEMAQTLDLRNCDRDDIVLEHHVSASDIMINLYPGSTITYYPSETDNEYPIEAGSKLASGFIFYSDTGNVDLSDYTFEYYLHEGYLDSNEGILYASLFVVWLFFLFAAIALMIMSQQYEKHIRERDTMIRESLDVFIKFIDAKDPYTEGHSERVADISRKIAARVGYKGVMVAEAYYSALVHDIGKCYIPDEILKKPSRLTDEEFEIIKTHTKRGNEMVRNYTSLPEARDATLCHHERYDGKGYPMGLKGEEIPLIGRILCVADSFDAMNSDRIYRKRLSRDIIIKEMKSNKGTQFDPKIVDVFLALLEEDDSLWNGNPPTDAADPLAPAKSAGSADAKADDAPNAADAADEK